MVPLALRFEKECIAAFEIFFVKNVLWPKSRNSQEEQNAAKESLEKTTEKDQKKLGPKYYCRASRGRRRL